MAFDSAFAECLFQKLIYLLSPMVALKSLSSFVLASRGGRPSERWKEGGLENLKVHKSRLEKEKEAWLQVNASSRISCCGSSVRIKLRCPKHADLYSLISIAACHSSDLHTVLNV